MTNDTDTGSDAPLSWTIGDVTITSIIESETATSPRFLFKGVDKINVHTS